MLLEFISIVYTKLLKTFATDIKPNVIQPQKKTNDYFNRISRLFQQLFQSNVRNPPSLVRHLIDMIPNTIQTLLTAQSLQLSRCERLERVNYTLRAYLKFPFLLSASIRNPTL
jgi:hypothetical protein